MNLFTRILSIGFITVVLSLNAIAGHGDHTSGPEGLSVSAGAYSYGLPAFVTSRDFREWQPPRAVPMIPSLARADYAWTDGFVIYFNPRIASQVPAKVMAFTIAHEYGHIYGRTSNENASDAFAARVYAVTDPGVCQAAVWWMNAFPNPGDATHLPSTLRARNIARECGI